MTEHTDLAPINPMLFSHLKQHDVLHATHPLFPLFPFGKTAQLFARYFQKPLVASLHTDVPKYTQIHTAEVIRRLFKSGWGSHLLLERWQIHQQARQGIERKLKRYLTHCAHVFVSQPDDYQKVTQFLPSDRVSYLRRGIDRSRFHPRQRDQEKLHRFYNISPEKFLLLYVGRLDACKNVQTFAQTVHILLKQDRPVHALMAGQGNYAQEIQTLLGNAVTLTGVVPQSTLAWLYTSADLFVFPSTTEICSNAVIEAKASGIPVLVSSQGGSAQLVRQSSWDGLLINSNDPEYWATAIATLMDNPSTLSAMGLATYQQSQIDYPTWETFLTKDLLSIWQSTITDKAFLRV
jgi:glycosyltransferase involved in cell wall biosynthesis